ncbi:MAG TPA: indolepyruvate ferredoxin oxidoreductase family protein [Solirubrobacterales bacterium]|nr:indolepyruvate ferredoxin oxidoreductase family protein [Solirubrobacterales bacterium]
METREGEGVRNRETVSLADKYVLESGRIFLTGVQALVRILLEQRRADRRAGLNTAAMVSGYQGSPLAGFDRELARLGEIATEESIFHVPGLNEELAATAVWGSQLANNLPDPRFEGVLGVWYGKAPGLDRAADAIRHGNWVGCGPKGGVVALVGDDPSSKSSTLPSASERLLADLGIPTLYPGSVDDALAIGRHAFELSRASGLWTAIKVVTNVADAAGTADLPAEPFTPRRPESNPLTAHRPHGDLLAPFTLELERSLYEVRLPRAVEYGRLNELNRVTFSARDAWLGVAAPGKSYFEVRQALADLGLGDAELDRLGLRLLKIGMPYPLDTAAVRDFAAGLEEILVVEEKRPFCESSIKEALYGGAASPRVLGKADELGRPLLAPTAELDSVTIAGTLVERLGQRVDVAGLRERVERLRSLRDRPVAPIAGARRTPFFCSGCPHNSSTPAPADSAVGVGIGCHAMILLNPEGKGQLAGLTQMGGEGAQWVGMEPFTGLSHFFQNLGDGTFHHSGSLAVRFAVAAGSNITFKLLYNRAVAMTGGQEVEGAIEVPELTHMLAAEGVRRIIVTTDEDRGYGPRLAPIAELRERGDLLAAQEELAATPGVTVLIHDQECAAELRRLRRRGKAPDPDLRVAINERVCEGCGDCGEKSSCLSVQPVETEFGRKTQIHQPSCNKDFSCLEGDCPSFVTVVGAKKPGARDPGMPPVELPAPEHRVRVDDFRVRMTGIGGTGVVTVNQVLGMAGLIDGKRVAGLDQTGLSQKGGSVVSDLWIAEDAVLGSSKAPAGGADLYLAFDLLTATGPANLAAADPERTVAVASTGAVPTGGMVTDTRLEFPELNSLLDRLETCTRPGEGLYLDAEALAMRLFDDHLPANLLLVGAAYQWGALPVSADAIEQAIRLNGAAVEKNLAAFAWGRACVVSPDLVEEVTRPSAAEARTREPSAAERELIAPFAGDEELTRLLEVRVPELVDYQSLAYANEYVEFVGRVREAEARLGRGSAIAAAVARQLYKLMAYKDEYEVARLHLLAAERAKLENTFGDDARFYWNLHPPVLRALGLKRKLRFGRWFKPVLGSLRRGRRLRGRAIDPFGHTRVRRTERALIGEYREAVTAAMAALDDSNRDEVLALCELPDIVRGYEEIKLRNVERYRAELADALAALGAGDGSRRHNGR